MPSTREKFLTLLDAYQAGLAKAAAQDGQQVPPWVALVALALPMARAECERRSEQFYADFADQMAGALCAFRGDERGGFVYLPGNLFDDGSGPLAASVDTWSHGDGAGYVICHLGPEVDLPPQLRHFDVSGVDELVRDLVAVSEQDFGSWLQRLGQVDVRPVAPPALPGPESGGGPGQ